MITFVPLLKTQVAALVTNTAPVALSSFFSFHCPCTASAPAKQNFSVPWMLFLHLFLFIYLFFCFSNPLWGCPGLCFLQEPFGLGLSSGSTVHRTLLPHGMVIGDLLLVLLHHWILPVWYHRTVNQYTVDFWTMQGLGAPIPPQSKICVKLLTPWDFTTNSLLLTRSLSNNINSRSTHILDVICIVYCILTRK